MKITGILAEKGFHVFDGESRLHNGRQTPRIWVIVMDRLRAHIYRKIPGRLELIVSASAKQKKGGAVFGDGGGVHHDHDPGREKRHHKDLSFVRALAAWLEDAERERVFDRLVLVAPPGLLGKVRSNLGKSVSLRVAAELNKDLVQLSEQEIKEHLKNIAWF